MLKKISIAVFWLAFFGFFLYKLIPKYKYLSDDTLKHWGSNSTFDNSIFAVHIFAGIVVYCTAILQFTPAIRNNYISFHRNTGKLYILSSLLCIIALYVMIPRTWCIACRPSQLTVTSLWLLFITLAYYFVRQRKIVLHQRMMISSFICAAYFVTVRVIDAYGMNMFYTMFPNQSTAYLASDVFVWLVPLLLFHLFWLTKEKKHTKKKIKKITSLLIAFLISTTLPAQKSLTTNQQAVQQTVINFFEALSNRDSISLKAYSTADITLYEYGQVWNIDTLILKAITLNQSTDFKRINTFDFINTTVKNTMTLVNYRLQSVINKDGKQATVQWLETVVLVKEKKQWRVKHLHSTLIKRG